MRLRVYLAGGIAAERDGVKVVRERDFRGHQTRLAFAYLACQRAQAVSRDELATIIWGDDPPPAVDSALSAMFSRLRGLIGRLGQPDEGVELASGFGLLRMRLPGEAWIDLEAASEAIDKAEGALRAGDFSGAFGPATVAACIARRPLLASDSSAWVTAQRRRMRRQLVRALDCLAQVRLRSNEPPLAVEAAAESFALEPLRESSARLLMEAYAVGGDRSEALRTYGSLRRSMVDELGAEPSGETERLYLRILG